MPSVIDEAAVPSGAVTPQGPSGRTHLPSPPPAGLFAAPVTDTQVFAADKPADISHLSNDRPSATDEPAATIVKLPVQEVGTRDDRANVVPKAPEERKPVGRGTDIIVDAIFSGRFCMVDLVPDLGALERGELSLVYRPIYDLITGAVVSLQTLPRWQPSSGGPSRPIDFVGSADMNGSTRSIGRWLVSTACQQVEELQQLTMRPDLSVRVPIFARQLDTTDLLDDVARALIDSQIEPEQLVLEVPEAAAMGGNSTARAIIDGLKALGVRLSIADFGSGYTSADYLQFLEVDEITVHCPFLPDPPRSWEDSGSVLDPLVKLTHAIGLRIVIESVDTFAQLTQSRDAGVRYAQGDLLSPPMEAERLQKAMSEAPQFSRAVRTAASL